MFDHSIYGLTIDNNYVPVGSIIYGLTVRLRNFTPTHLLMLPRRVVSEIDVPGASVQGRDPSQLKVPELKRWLRCRAASTRSLKADLVGR